MFSKIKKLFSHSIIYGLGNISTKLIGFLLIPLYTRYLSTEDYGLLSLCGVIGSVLNIIFVFGSGSAMFKSYFKQDDKKWQDMVITTNTVLIFFAAAPIVLMMALYSNRLADLILGNAAYGKAMLFVLITAFCTAMYKIPLLVMRVKDQSKKHSLVLILETLLITGGSILFVVIWKTGFVGVLKSQLYVGIFLCLLMFPIIFHDISIKFSSQIAKDLLVFGLPLIPAGLATFVINLSDRLFLRHYSTLNELGLYSLGNRFGDIIFFFTWAFQIAWPQFLFANENTPDAKRLYSKVTTYYIAVIGFVCLTVCMLSKEIIKLMAAPSFFEAYKVVPYIALSHFFFGLYMVGTVGVNLKKKTAWLPITTGVAAAFNLLLNYLWIPSYGMMGAAVATVVSYFLQFFLSVIVSLKYYPLPYEYFRITKIMGACIGIYLLSLLIRFDSLLLSMGAKFLLLLVYPFLLFISGFFEQRELKHIQELFSKSLIFVGLRARNNSLA